MHIVRIAVDVPFSTLLGKCSSSWTQTKIIRRKINRDLFAENCSLFLISSIFQFSRQKFNAETLLRAQSLGLKFFDKTRILRQVNFARETFGAGKKFASYLVNLKNSDLRLWKKCNYNRIHASMKRSKWLVCENVCFRVFALPEFLRQRKSEISKGCIRQEETLFFWHNWRRK